MEPVDPPAAFGPLYGFRRWLVTGGKLGGVFHVHPWVPVINLGGRSWAKAVCDGRYEAARVPLLGRVIDTCPSPPSEDCNCGFYASYDVPTDWNMLLTMEASYWALGVIEAAGNVVLHDLGFRAELARPVVLIGTPRSLPDADAERIAATWPDAMIKRVDRGEIKRRIEWLRREFWAAPE